MNIILAILLTFGTLTIVFGKKEEQLKPFTVTFYPEKFTLLTLSFGTGNAPEYVLPKNTEETLQKIEEVSHIVNNDGKFNPDYRKLEEYALCLAHEGKLEAAYEAFSIIEDLSDSPTEILCIVNGGTVMCANTVGSLGLEGAFAFAQVCLDKRVGDIERAKVIFREITDNGRNNLGIRAGDIWYKSARKVLELGACSDTEIEHYKKISEKAHAESW